MTAVAIKMIPRLSLSQARKDNGWLGDIIAVHTVGEYDIVEYLHKPAGNSEDKTRKLHFTPYINGDRTSHSFMSLDAALVGAIAYKHEGPNTRADGYFMRAIGAEKN